MADHSSSSSSDDEARLFPLRIPRRVRDEVPVPPENAAVPVNHDIAGLLGLAGEYVNNAFDILNDIFFGSYSISGKKKEFLDARKNVRSYMVKIHHLMSSAGNEAMPLPRELRKAFKFLKLRWPPVGGAGAAV